jgi:hypothetical protein
MERKRASRAHAGSSARATCDASRAFVKFQLRPQLPVILFAPLEIPFYQVTEMLSINGTARQRSLRDTHRAASGCPTITGSWSRPFANYRRELRTELDS